MAARHFWLPRITEAIQKKCDSCVTCKMLGRHIKPNLPSTDEIQLPTLSKSNEKIPLDFFGPITEKDQRIYILPSSFCKTTKIQTVVRFLEQYTYLNGIPKSIRTDTVTAFTGQKFSDFCKNHQKN